MVSNLPVIDWTLCTKLAGGDEAFAAQMLDRIVDDLQTQLPKLKALYVAQDYAALAQAVHRLRGGLAYCGLPRLKASAAQLETALKGPIMADLPVLFQQFERDIARLLTQYTEQQQAVSA